MSKALIPCSKAAEVSGTARLSHASVHDPRADGNLGDRHRAMEDRPGLDQRVDRWRDLVLQPVHIDRGVQHQRQIGRQSRRIELQGAIVPPGERSVVAIRVMQQREGAGSQVA